MSDIRFNSWLHRSGTGGVYQDSSGRVGIGTSVGMNCLVNSGPNALTFGTGTTPAERGRIDSSGRVLLGTTTVGSATADDLTVATSGDTGITVRSGTSDEGNIFFADGTSGYSNFRGYVQYNHSNNALLFGTNASERLKIDSSGNINVGTAATIAANGNATFSGIVTATSFVGNGANLTGITAVGGAAGVDFNDDVKIRSGTGNDLEIWHSSNNNSYIKNNTGTLIIDAATDGSDVKITSNTQAENMIWAHGNGEVALYHDNVKVFQTASQGIDFATDGHGITFSGQTAASGTGVSGTDIGQRFQDYEMGDWTPTDGSGTALTSDQGRYFKHGHLVYAAADCTFGNRSGGGTLTVDGLPYTIGSNAIGGGYLKYSDITAGQFTTYPLIHINPGTTALHFPGTTLSNTSQKRIDFVVIYVVYNF